MMAKDESGAASGAAPPARGRGAILFVVLLTSLMTPFASTALNIAIPLIGAEFNSAASSVGWLITSFMLCSVSFSVPFGKIADAVGRRLILLWGCAFYFASCVLAVFCPSLPWLIAARSGQGIGGAMLFATNTAILVDAFPAAQRGRVMGYFVAATYTGLSLGPVLGGMLTYAFGWRSIFIAMAVVCFISLASGILLMPEEGKRREPGEAGPLKSCLEDWRGMLLFMFGAFFLMYGFTTIGSSPGNLLFVALGLALCRFFVAGEKKAANPVINIKVFAHNRNFILSNLTALLNYAATYATSYLMSIYLQMVKGYDAREAGLFLITQPVLQVIISPLAGRLSDRYSPSKMASGGMAVCTAALILLAFAGEATALSFIFASLVIVGIGFGIFSSPNQNAIMSSVEPRDYGIASSILATCRNFGQTFSMALITIVMSLRLGNLSFTKAPRGTLVTTFHILFAVFSVICVAGIFTSMQRKPGRGRPEP